MLRDIEAFVTEARVKNTVYIDAVFVLGLMLYHDKERRQEGLHWLKLGEELTSQKRDHRYWKLRTVFRRAKFNNSEYLYPSERPVDVEQISSFQIPILRDMCKERCLTTSGEKPDLIKRLLFWNNNNIQDSKFLTNMEKLI